MKKVVVLITVLHLFTSVFCQAKRTNEEKLKERIAALEKAGWEAWKNKDISWFQQNTTAACLWVNSEGISNKEQMIKSVQTDCNVKSVSLDHFKFVVLNERTVLLTYMVNQDGYCGDKKLTERIRASVNYIKQGEKWLEAFYMETPVAE